MNLLNLIISAFIGLLVLLAILLNLIIKPLNWFFGNILEIFIKAEKKSNLPTSFAKKKAQTGDLTKEEKDYLQLKLGYYETKT